MIRIGMALVAMVAATPAVAADQFDLVCTAKKDVVRYRIDLATNEWCFGECKRVMKIAEVTAGNITLFDDKPTLPDNITAYNRIDRRTGAWEWYNYSPGLSTRAMDIKGSCEVAAFSGFDLPVRKF